MALVPFRVSGPSADQSSDERLVQLGSFCIVVRQRPAESGNTRHLQDGQQVEWPHDDEAGSGAAGSGRLANVGLVLWQSAFVLAEYLLRAPPFGHWVGVRVLELGCGTGLVGMALALAGARVVMTDLPHITPLAAANVAANCDGGSVGGAPVVLEYRWGQPAQALWAQLAAAGGGGGRDVAGVGAEPPEFDVVVAADVVYEPESHADLLASLACLCAPHTQVFLAYRHRGLGEEAFGAAALASGWALEAAPCQLLHEEHQDGSYRLLRLVRLDPGG